MKTNSYSVALCLGLSVSALYGSANAQSRYYSGPSVDVNFIATPPAEYQECHAKYLDSTARIYDACSFGVDEARRMAERFGGGKGKSEGYLRGFSWGLYSTIRNGSEDDAAAISLGSALNGDLLGQIKTAVQQGTQNAAQVAFAAGSSEVRTSFAKALDSGTIPSPQKDPASIPAPVFQSTIDPNDPAGAYGKYVGVPASISSLLNDPSIANASQVTVYSNYDTTYLGDAPAFNVSSYYFSDGTYRFEVAKWTDSNAALQQWLTRPIDTLPKYQALGSDTQTITVPGTTPGAPSTTTQQTVDLKKIFQTSFMNAYAYYVNYYYSSNFYSNLDTGQKVGEAIGKQVRYRYVENNAEVQTFNAKFLADEKSAFMQAYNASYLDGFAKTYADYANHPKLEIDSFDLVQEVQDGIIQPGEKFGVAFKVKNYGLVATSVQANVDGAENATVSPSYSVPSLRTTVITTPFLASMSNSIRSSANVNLTLNVSGAGIASIAVQETEQVLRQVTPYGIAASLDVPHGTAIITVKAKNNSQVASSSSARVVLTDMLGRQIELNIGSVLGGQVATATFSIAGLSPLDLLTRGAEVTAQLFLGDTYVDQLSLTAVSQNPQADIAASLAVALANSSQKSLANDLQNELISRIDHETQTLARRAYKNNASSTYLGSLLASYGVGQKSAQAQATYSQIAQKLWPMRKRFSDFLWLFKSANRKYFEAACTELNGGQKLQ